MSQKLMSGGVFRALWIAALWFYVYVVAHELLAPLFQDDTHTRQNQLTLHSPPPELSPRSALRTALDNLYAEGAAAFTKCAICHSQEDGTSRFGPHLGYFIGEPVARFRSGNADYRYSPTLRAIGDSGAVWSVGRLWSFIESPEHFAPGTRMPFPGLKDDHQQIKLIVHYLAWSCRPDCEPPVALRLPIDRYARTHWQAVTETEMCLDLGADAEAGAALAQDPEVFLVPADVARCDKHG